MRAPYRRSLNRQLLLLGALPAALMFVGLMLFFTTARLSDARADLFTGTQVMADNLAPALEYAVVSGNLDVLQQVIDRAMSNGGVEWIRVTDVLGNEIGAVYHPDVDPGALPVSGLHRFDSDILQLPLELGNGGRMEWFEPEYRLNGGALRLGSVEVAVSERVLQEKRFDIMLTSGVVGISLLVFTLLLVNRMLTPVIEPIRGLSERVKELIARNYRDTGPPDRKRVAEIAELEINLNALSEHLAQLKESRDHTLAVSEGARQKAEAANLAKSEFLAVMSHELRTPLNGVLGMLDLVSEGRLSQRQQDYVETARRSTEDLLTLINDILDYSQLDQGTLRLSHSRFDPARLVANCVASFRHLAESQGLRLEHTVENNWPEGAEVRGDATRFRQIVACLVDNALKFSEQGQVTVTLCWHQESADTVFVGCEVTDTGRGIPADRMADIFNGFEQLDSSSSRPNGGTGIGLALVQRLVELMGGHIRLTSTPGKGSCFRFEVPFDRPAEPDTTTSDQATAVANHPDLATAPAVAGAGKRSAPAACALVVEDNLVNQRVARALLERLGFAAEAVTNGEEALASVRARQGEHYAVILMDCQMPVMDGYSATRAIREWEQEQRLKPVPIIALTADALPGTEGACHEAGMNDYLAKPVRKEQLRQVLSRWVPL